MPGWFGSSWFETVAEAQRRAQRRLPPSVYKALLAGSERGTSYEDNLTAFGELGLSPHVAGNSAARDLATTVMGQDVSMPVLISPTGVQAVHPEGEVAVARAAAARGTAMGLSSFASRSVEDVMAANPVTFFQMYWMGSRESMERRMARARDAGVVGLIATLDWSFSHGRDWGSPHIPDKVDLKAMIEFAPEVLRRPWWLTEYARTGRIPDLTTPNLTDGDGPAPTFFTPRVHPTTPEVTEHARSGTRSGSGAVSVPPCAAYDTQSPWFEKGVWSARSQYCHPPCWHA